MTSRMGLRRALMTVLMHEDINFLVTNRLPRRLATRVVGHIARVEHPMVARPAIAAWRFFCGPDLSDSPPARYRSLREAFTRPLRPAARCFAADPRTITSPADAILGAHGRIDGDRLYQVKGFPYRLGDLLPDPALAERFRDGSFATLRLTAGMYHRFHAPADLTLEAVTYLSGDCWNVNPIALRRVERLFCRNERAVIETRLADGTPLLLVPVAAILVASIHLAFLDVPRALRERPGERITVRAAVARGDELGWFEHGSTILVFAPPGTEFAPDLSEGQAVRAGQAMMRRAQAADRSAGQPA